MTEHTPTPWEYDGEYVWAEAIKGYVLNPDTGDVRSNAVRNANAEYAVLSVNSHADLVDALRGLVYETTHMSPLESDGSHKCRITADALAKARAALALATPTAPQDGNK